MVSKPFYSRLEINTRIGVRLQQQLPADGVQTGQPIQVDVADDLVIVGVIVIRRGTPVIGRIDDRTA